MKYPEMLAEMEKYIYTEDDSMLRIALASVIATRMKIGEPVWIVLIGASSSGKSQVLRPLALTDTKFIHRIDDMTESTLLSGSAGKEDKSLLNKIGKHGIIVISDFTVLFSRKSESRDAILSQFRMVYDGEMTKHVGNSKDGKPITWKGSLGVVAGSTPSIYHHFEEVADMGERFIYFRLKNYDVEKATRKSLSRTVYGRELDGILSDMYAEYIKEVVSSASSDVPNLSMESYDRIVNIALFAAQLRTPIHYDKFTREVDRIPVSEMPMRIASQLMSIARALSVMRLHDDNDANLTEKDLSIIEWCAYSLANEERRACLRVLAAAGEGKFSRTSEISDIIGLSPRVTITNLQHLSAIGIIDKISGSNDREDDSWGFAKSIQCRLVRRMEGMKEERNENVREEGVPNIPF